MRRLLGALLIAAWPASAQVAMVGAPCKITDGSCAGTFARLPAPAGCAAGYVPYFDASLKLQCSPTVYAPSTNTTTLGTLAARNVTVTALPASGSVTVTNQGTAGATTYTYSVQACLADGTCNAAGAASTTAAGHATLSASNFNRLTWSAVAGAASYKIRRDVGGATQGVIWTGPALTVDDTGLAGDGTAKPTVDRTGAVTAKTFSGLAIGRGGGYGGLAHEYGVAVGAGALFYNSSGANNTATGFQSLYSNSSGNDGTAVGFFAAFGNTSGAYVTAIGSNAARTNSTGGYFVAAGANSLRSSSTGSGSVAVGYSAGYESGAVSSTANAVTTGSYLTFIGFRAGLGSATQRTNSTAIGNGAYVDADNTVVLGNGSVTDVLAGSTGLARVTQGETKIQTVNGAAWYHGSISELITLSTAGTTTDSTANLLPANAIIEAVVVRITTTIGTATDWKVGDATTPGRFIAANSTLVAGTTAVGLVHVDQTGAAGPRQITAAKLRFETTGIPSAGVARATVFYRQFTPPAS